MPHWAEETARLHGIVLLSPQRSCEPFLGKTLSIPLWMHARSEYVHQIHTLIFVIWLPRASPVAVPLLNSSSLPASF